MDEWVPVEDFLGLGVAGVIGFREGIWPCRWRGETCPAFWGFGVGVSISVRLDQMPRMMVRV